MVDAEISLRLGNRLPDMEPLAPALEDFAQSARLSARAAFHLNLAIDEFVSNAINHGYADGRDGEIEIRVVREGAQLRLVIRDDGDPFDPFTAPEPATDASIEDRSIGGLGVHLVRRFADRFSYAREKERNVVTLLFDLEDAADVG